MPLCRLLVLPLVLLSFGVASGCARAPLKTPESAMRRASAPELKDDLPRTPLIEAVRAQISFMEAKAGSAEASPVLKFGEVSYTRDEYLQGLKRFLELSQLSDDQAFSDAVKKEFDFFEVYGQKDWSEVFITSYYEPEIPGSLKPTPQYSQPLYSKPADLVTLDLSLFDPKFGQERKYRGRLVGNSFVPYFSRAQIDSLNALKDRKLEICWVDPIDAFFLQVQGSGTVVLNDGRKLRINYAEKNGHSYEAVGKFLKSLLPPDSITLAGIESVLRNMPKDEMQRYLNMNPSYVFFKVSDESALTYLGVPATDGRTIATDPRYFPKGALAILSFEKPRFGTAESPNPESSTPVARFVLDQDIGGAITGGGRVDLFWGRGADAKRHAGVMKNYGRLWYLAPKKR